jgi:hypothetical protein
MEEKPVKDKVQKKNKSPAKKKPAKVISPGNDVLVNIGDDNFIYNQIVIITKRAPKIKIKPLDLKFAKVPIEEINNFVTSDPVIRVVRQSFGLLVITGHKLAKELIDEGKENIEVSLVNISVANKCIVPPEEPKPKLLTPAELAERINKIIPSCKIRIKQTQCC